MSLLFKDNKRNDKPFNNCSIFLNEHPLEAVIQSDETVGNKCNRVKEHIKIYANDVIEKINLEHELLVTEKSKHEISLQACNFLKKRPQHRCLPVEFVKLEQWCLLLKTCYAI